MKVLQKILLAFLLCFAFSDSGYTRIHSLSHGGDEEGPSLAEGGGHEGHKQKESSSSREVKEDSKEAKASESSDNKPTVTLLTPEEIKNKIQDIDWLSWLIRLVRIAVILACARMLWKVLKIAIQKHINTILAFQRKKNNGQEQSPLFKTIVPIIESIVRWALMILTTLVVLSDLGVDIAPIILSFSVVGIAISLGSQELVKDLINGILTLFDGNIAVGDTVRIGSHVGTVETMSLRAIVLRHASGELQTIPFSEAKGIVNCSRGFNIAEICISLAPNANLHHVHTAFSNVYNELQRSAVFGPKILSPLSEIGVKSITVGGAVFVAALKIKPDPEKEFTGEFLKCLYEECQKLHIPIAYHPLMKALHESGHGGGGESEGPAAGGEAGHGE